MFTYLSIFVGFWTSGLARTPAAERLRGRWRWDFERVSRLFRIGWRSSPPLLPRSLFKFYINASFPLPASLAASSPYTTTFGITLLLSLPIFLACYLTLCLDFSLKYGVPETLLLFLWESKGLLLFEWLSIRRLFEDCCLIAFKGRPCFGGEDDEGALITFVCIKSLRELGPGIGHVSVSGSPEMIPLFAILTSNYDCPLIFLS